MWEHKGLLSKREGDLNRREESLTAHSAELRESKAKLDGLELSRRQGKRASWIKQLCSDIA